MMLGLRSTLENNNVEMLHRNKTDPELAALVGRKETPQTVPELAELARKSVYRLTHKQKDAIYSLR